MFRSSRAADRRLFSGPRTQLFCTWGTASTPAQHVTSCRTVGTSTGPSVGQGTVHCIRRGEWCYRLVAEASRARATARTDERCERDAFGEAPTVVNGAARD